MDLVWVFLWPQCFSVWTVACLCLPVCLSDRVSAYRTEWPGKVHSDEHAVQVQSEPQVSAGHSPGEVPQNNRNKVNQSWYGPLEPLNSSLCALFLPVFYFQNTLLTLLFPSVFTLFSYMLLVSLLQKCTVPYPYFAVFFNCTFLFITVIMDETIFNYTLLLAS